VVKKIKKLLYGEQFVFEKKPSLDVVYFEWPEQKSLAEIGLPRKK
jgi:hypothetical protein